MGEESWNVAAQSCLHLKLIIAPSLTAAVKKGNARNWTHVCEAKGFAKRISMHHENVVVVRVQVWIDKNTARAEYTIIARYKNGEEVK